jgi:2-amino-4-hydroxy-6-hydroxymethyldihydropteridine diphosphokinase
MAISYILLGSNLGDKLFQLNTAVAHIQEKGLCIIAQSKIYQTKAWGNVNQDDFLNVVLQVETKLKPLELLDTLLAIELQMGRQRGEEQWLPRLIDIDILYFNNQIVDLPNLKIPHPFIAQRRFTLMPLNDLAPNFIHPKIKMSNKQLLTLCQDQGMVNITTLQLQIRNTALK